MRASHPLLLVAAALFVATIAPEATGGEGHRVTADFVDEDIRTVVRHIARAGKLNVVMSPKVEGRVTAHLHAASPLRALEQCVRVLGHEMLLEDHGIARILPAADLTAAQRKRVRKRSEGRVTISFRDVDVRDVIAAIVEQADASVVLSPDVTGKVTVALTNVPWRDAIRQIVRTLGYAAVESSPGLLSVGRGSPAGERTAPPARPLRLQVRDQDLRAVFLAVAKHGGASIVVSPKVKAAKVTLATGVLPWREVLDALAEGHGATVVEDASGILRIEPR